MAKSFSKISQVVILLLAFVVVFCGCSTTSVTIDPVPPLVSVERSGPAEIAITNNSGTDIFIAEYVIEFTVTVIDGRLEKKEMFIIVIDAGGLLIRSGETRKVQLFSTEEPFVGPPIYLIYIEVFDQPGLIGDLKIRL